MLWFYLMVALALTLTFVFYANTRRVRRHVPGRRPTLTEASAEIGAPPYASLPKEVELDWQASEISEDYALPSHYGRDRLVLMARDPRWIYAYWEITHEKHQEMLQKHVLEWGFGKPVLRLYDLSPRAGEPALVDVALCDEADSWYVRIDRPRHRFVAEIGRLFSGKFVSLVRSNEVALPPETVSETISEEWSPLDWEAHYGRFAGNGRTSSPLEWGR